jgi:4-aminobutyrate aminotransferase-like enzyme
MWAHEHFGMAADAGPNVVTAAKKMQLGAIFHDRDHRPRQEGRIINTWVGDPHKLIMLKAVSG